MGWGHPLQPGWAEDQRPCFPRNRYTPNTPWHPKRAVPFPPNSCPPCMRGKRLSTQVSHFFLAAVDLPLLLRRQRKHCLSVLVCEVKFILERGKETQNMHHEYTNSCWHRHNPPDKQSNQCGVTPWHGSDPTASPVTPHLPGNDANAHPALADLS